MTTRGPAIVQHRLPGWLSHIRKNFNTWLRDQQDRYGLSVDTPMLQLCKHFESFRPRWYRCDSGVWTIGYGYTGPRADVMPEPWTEEYAAKVLALQLRGQYRREAEQALLKCGMRLSDFAQHEQWAIVSLVHNNGPKAIWTVHNRPATWVLRVKAGDCRLAVEQAWYMWNQAGEAGKLAISPGLVRRRFAEMRLYFDNVLDFDPIGWRQYYRNHGGA